MIAPVNGLSLHHTGLTWMADAGVPIHVLRKIAGHGSLATTQLYLHPNLRSLTLAGEALSAHLTTAWSPGGPQDSGAALADRVVVLTSKRR